MATTTHRLSVTGALIVCLVGNPWSGALRASDDEGLSGGSVPTISVEEDAIATTDVSTVLPIFTSTSRVAFADDALTRPSPFGSPFGSGSGSPLESIVQGSGDAFHLELDQPSAAYAGQIYRGRPRRMRNGGRGGSIAAIVIGAAASITGTAILVYANRPECRTRPFATGCGYGTKVVGGAVLSGGIVGLAVGALTWR